MCHCAPRRCHAHGIARAVRDLLHGRGVSILADDGERASAEAAFGTHSRLVTESAAHTDNSEGDHDGDAAAQTNGDVSDQTRRTDMHTATHISRSNAPSGAGMTAVRAPSQLIDKLLMRLNNQRNKRAFETFMRELPNPNYFRAHQRTATGTDTGGAAHGLETDDELPNEPHETGADDEGTGAMAQSDEQDERSHSMGVADETPVQDAESAQRREVEVPVECVMCIGDGGGETSQGQEGAHNAGSRGGIDDGERRVGRGAQGAEDDEGDKAMKGDEDASKQRVESGSGSTGDDKKRRPPRKRAKGTGSQQQRQDRKRPGWAREA